MKNKIINKKSISGFTLMELMIVIAIIGILAAIAIPSYSSYVEKGRRMDAKTGLMDIQLQQVQWRNNHTSYATTANIVIKASTYYDFAIPTNTATSFTATASPSGAQIGDDCGIFQINLDGPDYPVDDEEAKACWGR